MADLDRNLQASAPIKLVGNDELYAVDVVVENGFTKLLTKTTIEVIWDTIEVTFPETNQDLFTYKKELEVVMEVLVTYADPSKKTIVSVSKTVV